MLYATIVALAATAFLPLAEAAAAQVLRRGTANEPRTLDPQYVQGNAGAAIMYDMFEGLVAIGADGRLIPGQAESWKRSDDGLVYTFKLREGLKWSDGTALTSADFIYSWRRALDPKNAARSPRVLFPIENARDIISGTKPPESLGVSAPDARTLVVKLSQPTAYFIELVVSFSAAPVPRHVIERHGDAWTQPRNIVTNGAFTLEEFASNSFIRLRKNPRYRAAGETKLDAVVYYPIERPTTAFTRFRAGELEVAFGVPANRLDFVRQNFGDELHSAEVSGVYYLLVNNSRAPLNDARVRRALSMAIDRRVITSGILRIGERPAYTLVPPLMEGYGDNEPAWGDDSIEVRRQAARALLREAGYGPGKPLRIEYKSGGQENNRRIAVAVQAMWKEIGVEARIENVGASTVVLDAASGNYDVMRYQYYAPYEDPVAFLNLLTSDSTINLSRYSNDDYDRMIIEADRIADPAKRLEQLRKAERIAFDATPVIPIYFNKRFYLVSTRVRGWHDNTRGENLSRFLSLAP